ncbi:MAG: hypothetical protein HY722_13805 [Planctomycetes bacterium]|nr:hypothetical protein [Planctomycetota bacterium]
MHAAAVALLVLVAQALPGPRLGIHDREAFDPDVLYPAVQARAFPAMELRGKVSRDSFDSAGNVVGDRLSLDRNLGLDPADASGRMEVALAGRTRRDREGYEEEARLSLAYQRLHAEGLSTAASPLTLDDVGFPAGTGMASSLTVNSVDVGADWVMEDQHLRLAYHFGGVAMDTRVQVASSGGANRARAGRTTFLPSLGVEVAVAPIRWVEVFGSARGFAWRWDDGDNDRFSASFLEARSGAAIRLAPALRLEAAWEILGYAASGERGRLDRELDLSAQGLSVGVVVPWGLESRPGR